MIAMDSIQILIIQEFTCILIHKYHWGRYHNDITTHRALSTISSLQIDVYPKYSPHLALGRWVSIENLEVLGLDPHHGNVIYVGVNGKLITMALNLASDPPLLMGLMQ